MALACAFRVPMIWAQDCHLTLQGTILVDGESEPLAYAQVYIQEVQKGAQTDENGHFSITNLCENQTYTIEVRHVECQHETRILKLTENTTLKLNLHHTELKTVTVSEKAIAPKTIQSETDVKALDLESAKGTNLAETMRRIPGINSLQTGSTIAKPIIQGMHSNRIAIIQNGTALEAQQWGTEHAPEVDPFTAGAVSVVKGAAALQYGIGALGGAIVITPPPLRTQAGIGGWMASQLHTNGRGGVFSGAMDWNPRGKSLAFRVQGTVKALGNLRTPRYFMQNTGQAERDLSALAGWKQGKFAHNASFTFVNQTIGIFRGAHIGNTTDLKKAIESDIPVQNIDAFSRKINRPYQLVSHISAKYAVDYRISEKWKANAGYTFQYNRRQEFDAHPPLSDPQDLLKKPQIAFRIFTNQVDLGLSHFPIRHWEGKIGGQILQQTNQVGKGGFIPDYNTMGGGIWLTERWRKLPNPWEFDAGIRYDVRKTHAMDAGNFIKLDKTVVYHNVSGAVGAIYRVSKVVQLSAHTGWAMRPPHVNELFARGVHHGSATFEQGDSSLVSEKAWTNQVSLEWRTSKWDGTVTFYRNQVFDFIYLEPQEMPVLTVRGAFPAYWYKQANAVLQGVDAQLNWHVIPHWSVEGSASVLRGFLQPVEGSGETNWLPLMPSDKALLALQWTRESADQAAKTYIRLGGQFVFKQTRIPAEGLLKPAPDTYFLMDFMAGFPFKMRGSKVLDTRLVVRNLTNAVYRDYLDFFRYFTDSPGIDIAVQAKFTF